MYIDKPEAVKAPTRLDMSRSFESVIDEEISPVADFASADMVSALEDNTYAEVSPISSSEGLTGSNMLHTALTRHPPDSGAANGSLFGDVFHNSGSYPRGDDSDNSVVEYNSAMILDATARAHANRRRIKPKKIIITVTPSDLLGYPLFRISQCLSVLRFQRSLVDIGAESDGIYRKLLVLPNLLTITSPSGLGFTKNLVVSIWRRHGIMGFFRGFPEFIAHKLMCDVMTFVVPSYIAPKVELAGSQLINYLGTFEYGCLSHIRITYMRSYGKSTAGNNSTSNHHYLSFWEGSTFQRFVRRNIKFDAYDYMVSVIVEALTYPALTISSKMMIYDGKERLNAFSLANCIVCNDGAAALYSGFTCQLVALLLQHLEKQKEEQMRHLSFTMDDLNTPLDQCVPIFLTIGQMICQQISLVQRCGSIMDGFCSRESSLNILSRFSWVNISSQLLLTVGLMHLKDKVLDEH